MKHLLPMVLVFALVLGSIESSLSQTLWQDTACGMSPEEVLKAVPNSKLVTDGRVVRNIEGVELVRLDTIEIVKQNFDVGFFFKDQKLCSVFINLTDKISYTSACSAFEQLCAALRSKYGDELSSEDKGYFKRRKWNSGNANISLTAFNMNIGLSSDSPAILNIIYDVSLSKEADKL